MHVTHQAVLKGNGFFIILAAGEGQVGLVVQNFHIVMADFPDGIGSLPGGQGHGVEMVFNHQGNAFVPGFIS